MIVVVAASVNVAVLDVASIIDDVLDDVVVVIVLAVFAGGAAAVLGGASSVGGLQLPGHSTLQLERTANPYNG